ncbi:bifunctional DNA primase/polymerase, partial [Actinomadura sp. KC216]|uniref:bifunctional DNA primase/polymerase n=1 Tax=Actinomadura sp. KC216 TaxID=2530370 RepID=UPI00104752F9
DWENRATTDPDRIPRCWTTGPYNIGIACGPSGLLVIDLDTSKPGQHPPPPWDTEPGINDGADVFAALCEQAAQPFPTDTLTVATPSGGMHLYFTVPGGAAANLRNTTGRHVTGLGWLIDTRGGGGYVLAPPSTVQGRPYRLVTDLPPAPLPEWLSALLSARRAPSPLECPPSRSGDVRDVSAYIAEALKREGERVRSAQPGGRNFALNKAAYNLGRLIGAGALTEGIAYTTLNDAATVHYGPDPDANITPGAAHSTITAGLNAGIRNPRQLPHKTA